MCLLLETLKVCDGSFQHSRFHQERIDRSQSAHFKEYTKVCLQDIAIPVSPPSDIIKCRLLYGTTHIRTEFTPYERKSIRRLRLIEANHLVYPFKYADRRAFDALLSGVGENEEVIIVKNGKITDTSFSNLAFLSGNSWITPATPLLLGTCRARLLHEGRITEGEIRPEDLHRFRQVSLINAMLDLGELNLPVLEIFR